MQSVSSIVLLQSVFTLEVKKFKAPVKENRENDPCGVLERGQGVEVGVEAGQG